MNTINGRSRPLPLSRCLPPFVRWLLCVPCLLAAGQGLAQADLALSAQALPSNTSMIGQPVTLRFRVQNLGPEDAANVEVRTTDIAHFALPDESDCFWVISRPSGDFVDPTLMALTLVIGPLPAGGEHTCNIRLSRSVRAGSTTFQSNAVGIDNEDPGPENHSTITTLIILGAPAAIPAVSVPGTWFVVLAVLAFGTLALRRSRSAGVLAVVLVLHGLMGATDAAADEPLFLAISAAGGEVPPGALEHHSVIPNLAGLSQDPEEVGVLLPGIPYEVAQRVRFELRQEGFLWVGRTAPGRDIVLTSNGSLLNGMIVSPTGRWAIQPAGAGHLLLLADDTAEPPDIVELPPAVLRHDPPTEPAGAGPIVIDVMILFTRQAAEGAGGGQAMRNLAQYAVDVQNVVMANSGMIDVTFNLVHTRAVRRNDSGNSLADLEWLRTDPEPMYLRDLYGADLVTLAADSLGGVSGRAYLQISPGPGFAPFAVSVVLRPIMGTSFIYQHEVGHSLGMDHSIENATVLPPNGSFPWSY